MCYRKVHFDTDERHISKIRVCQEFIFWGKKCISGNTDGVKLKF